MSNLKDYIKTFFNLSNSLKRFAFKEKQGSLYTHWWECERMQVLNQHGVSSTEEKGNYCVIQLHHSWVYV